MSSSATAYAFKKRHAAELTPDILNDAAALFKRGIWLKPSSEGVRQGYREKCRQMIMRAADYQRYIAIDRPERSDCMDHYFILDDAAIQNEIRDESKDEPFESDAHRFFVKHRKAIAEALKFVMHDSSTDAALLEAAKYVHEEYVSSEKRLRMRVRARKKKEAEGKREMIAKQKSFRT